jgi:hypothetical protein
VQRSAQSVSQIILTKSLHQTRCNRRIIVDIRRTCLVRHSRKFRPHVELRTLTTDCRGLWRRPNPSALVPPCSVQLALGSLGDKEKPSVAAFSETWPEGLSTASFCPLDRLAPFSLGTADEIVQISVKPQRICWPPSEFTPWAPQKRVSVVVPSWGCSGACRN